MCFWVREVFVSRTKHSLVLFPIFCLFFWLIFGDILWAFVMINMHVPFRAEHSFSNNQSFEQLGISILTTFCLLSKIEGSLCLWVETNTYLWNFSFFIYVLCLSHHACHLEGSVTAWPLSKKSVVGSTLEIMAIMTRQVTQKWGSYHSLYVWLWRGDLLGW